MLFVSCIIMKVSKMKKIMDNFKECFFYLLTSISLIILGHFIPKMFSYKYTDIWNALSRSEEIDKILCSSINKDIIFTILGFIFLIWGFYRTLIQHNSDINELKKTHKNELDALENKFKTSINCYQERIEDLDREIYTLHQNVPDIWLKMMFEKFDFSAHVRVSIYFMYEEQFHLLSRHSDNPNFKETHTPTHGKDEGILSQIWSDGVAEERDCPHPKNIRNYIDYVAKKYNYDESIVKMMAMKSCRYLGTRINYSREGIGLLLIESLDECFFEKYESSVIIDYINRSNSHLTKIVLTGKEYKKREKTKVNSNKEQNTPEQDMKSILKIKGIKYE